MRMSAAVVAAFAAFAVSSSVQAEFDRSRYVLAIDRAPYSLDRKVLSPDSASAGSSRRYASAPKASGSDLPPSTQREELRRLEPGQIPHPDSAALRIREQQHEYQVRELERERDAWRRRAEVLESELRMSDATGRSPLRFPLPPVERYR